MGTKLGMPRPTPGAIAVPQRSAAPVEDSRATVLLVGSGDPMEAALSLALGRYGLSVEASPMADAMQAVFVHAPDLAVLIGDAAKEEGGEVLAALAGRASTAVVPVALLTDDPDLEHRLRAFRYGAVAVVPRSPSADEMARRIADIVKELPERDKSGGADLGETTLEELIRLVSTRLRSGILSVKAAGQTEGARIVLRGGQPVTEAIEQLVASIRPLVASPSGAIAFEFEEQPTGRLAAIADAEVAPAGEMDVRAALAGRRFVLVERSPTRADDLVQALRGLGAHVAVVDGEGQGMEKARAIAPEVVVVDARGIGGWASPALRIIRHDLRLRWASLLVARADELWPEGAPGADLSRLASGLRPLIEADASLTERAQTEEKFSARLEGTGPERFLRALLAAGKTLHVRVQHPRAIVDVDLAEGLIVGATAKGVKSESLRPGASTRPVEVSGAGALAVLLGLASGRAQIEQRKAPSLANIMSPLDDALAAADREAPPIRPSLPPPSIPPVSGGSPGTSSHPGPQGGSLLTSALLSDPPELLRQLESLLIDLRRSIPAPSPLDAEAAELEGTASTKQGTPSVIVDGNPSPGLVPGGTIPRPAPTPTLGARKATLVGMRAPGLPSVDPASGPSSLPAMDVSSSELIVLENAATAPPAGRGSALNARVSLKPPPADADSLAQWLEPESGESEGGEPSAQPHSLGPTPEAIAHAPAPSPLPEEPLVVPTRSGRGLFVGLFLVMLLAAGGGAAWFFLRAGGSTLLSGAGDTAAIDTTPVGIGSSPVGPLPPPDGGVPPSDVGLADAGVTPLGPADVGAPDGGQGDSGLGDAGADAGLTEERVAEAGEAEAAEAEAGAVDDATLTATDRRARIEYLIDRANFRRRHGEPEGATSDYEAVLRLEPTNARALAGLARVNLDRGRGDDAVRYARRLTRSHSTQPANYVLLGDCLLSAGDRSGAIRAFQDALRIQPSYRTARERIARLPPR